jgi:hypothetical protein
MRREARTRLAAEQEALVRALVHGAPVPTGFDAARLGVAAAQVRAKRQRRSACSHGRENVTGDEPASAFARLARWLRGR